MIPKFRAFNKKIQKCIALMALNQVNAKYTDAA